MEGDTRSLDYGSCEESELIWFNDQTKDQVTCLETLRSRASFDNTRAS